MTPALIAGGGALLGGLISGMGAKKASQQQERALREAMGFRREMFGNAQNAWSPYMGAGQDAWRLLAPMLGLGENSGNPLTGGGDNFGSLIRQFDPAGLENTPDYRNAMRAAQNSAAARGLGSSGNALMMASGAADQVYGNAFDRYWRQNKSIFDSLWAPVGLGAQGANSLTNAATQTGAGLAGDATGIGNAQAAGTNALYGGIASGLQGGANAASQHLMYGPLVQAQTQYFQNRMGGGAQGYGNNMGDFNPNVPGGFMGAGPTNSAVGNPLLWQQSAGMGGW